uniref:EF-hand domain-containing protein n=1 Tax=Octactis speculum TaxID=3111310 RepID=A0A7S2FKF6_9STRA
MISDGSELLLLVPSLAGVVGSCVLPILGAVPDGMIVLFSGTGPNAQEQLNVGVGALAGSTIMLLTIPWALSIYAGRVNIDSNGVPQYNKAGRKMDGKVVGVGNDTSVRIGGSIMMITSVSYLLLQVPALFMENDSIEEVAEGEKMFAALGFFLCVFLFVGYIIYQYLQSQQDAHDVSDMKRETNIINQINKKQITLKGALFHEITQASSGKSEYEAVEGDRVWDRLPKATKERVGNILKYFYRQFDGNKSNSIDKDELGKIFQRMNEPNKKQSDIDSIFSFIDTDHDGKISLEEFIVGTVQFVSDHGNEINQELKKIKLSPDVESVEDATNPEDGDESDDDGEMPEDLVGLDVEEQQRRLLMRSFQTMALGTFLVVVFSDPMTDVLGDIGRRSGVPAFYVSFVLAPVASNASELLASYNYSSKKTRRSISIGLQALQGAACMNNTFCLAIFMGLIYFKGLAWRYTAETISIIVGQFAVALFSCQKNQTLMTMFLALMTYPGCLILVYVLENHFGLD